MNVELGRDTYTGALGGVDVGLAADELRVATTDTGNLGKGIDALLLAVAAVC